METFKTEWTKIPQKIQKFIKTEEIPEMKKRFARLASVGHGIFVKKAIKINSKNIRQMALKTFDFGGNMPMRRL